MPEIEACPSCPKGSRPGILIGGLCGYHFKHPNEKIERTDITLEKKAAKAKPVIPKVSGKRKKQDYQYNKIRKKVLKEKPTCQAQLPGCTKVATDIHHMEGRAGDNYLDESKMLPVCRSCHTCIENHPELAKEKGLSLSRIKVKS